MPSKELIGASTIPIILTILTDGENYGYELIKKVKEYSGDQLQWSEAMLYPVLHRMQRDNMINSRWEQLENGRKRKYYSITKTGRVALEEKKEEWQVMLGLFQRMWKLDPI